MIVLSNGDKWILDDSEWEAAGISYEDATACKLPIMTPRRFIEKLVAANEPGGKYLLPRKWTNAFPEGYWDCNFDPYKEVFTDAAIRTITNDWSTVYVMRWGHIYVIYQKADSGGYDVCTGIAKFESFEAYTKAIIGEVVYQIKQEDSKDYLARRFWGIISWNAGVNPITSGEPVTFDEGPLELKALCKTLAGIALQEIQKIGETNYG